MLIDDYFQEIEKIINDFDIIIQSFELETDSRTFSLGIIRGDIYFNNNSHLHLREFINLKLDFCRGKYCYQYMDNQNNLIFRYDNAQHHQKLNLPNFPHHKHDRDENKIVSSHAPNLDEILEEIKQIIKAEISSI